jgi:hypothetical protein
MKLLERVPSPRKPIFGMKIEVEIEEFCRNLEGEVLGDRGKLKEIGGELKS